MIFKMRDISINSNLEPLTKFRGSSINALFKDKYSQNVS